MLTGHTHTHWPHPTPQDPSVDADAKYAGFNSRGFDEWMLAWPSLGPGRGGDSDGNTTWHIGPFAE